MRVAVDTTQESSVMFNLRELVRLEEDRIAREQREVQFARDAVQRARDEQERAAREAAELESKRAAEAAQRAQIERDAALLRVKLEADAAERSREQHVEQAHLAELQ